MDQLVKVSAIGQSVESIQSIALRQKATFAVQCTVAPKLCPAATSIFTGREEILEKLLWYFHPETTIRGPRIFVITGLGGIGKTQIAYRFVEMAESDTSVSR